MENKVAFRYGARFLPSLFKLVTLGLLAYGSGYVLLYKSNNVRIHRHFDPRPVFTQALLWGVFLLCTWLSLAVLLCIVRGIGSVRSVILAENFLVAPKSCHSRMMVALKFRDIRELKVQSALGKKILEVRRSSGTLKIPEANLASRREFETICDRLAANVRNGAPEAAGKSTYSTRQPAHQSHSSTETAMDEQRHKNLLEAAEFFCNTAKKLLTQDGRLHAETLIASVSRMAGSMMYRSFGHDAGIEPGTAVMSDQANVQGPKLMDMMFVTLKQFGHQVGEGDLDRDYLSPDHSQLSFEQAHQTLAPFFLKYCDITKLPMADAGIAGAIASAILVHECREVIAVQKGAALAVWGFVEGTKTAPWPVEAGDKQG